MPTTTHRPGKDAPTRLLRALFIAGCAQLAAVTLAAGTAAADTPTCDRVAAPGGDDSAAGTAAAPLRTAQALADALAPGQTGCLRGGTYVEDLRVNHGGNAGAPITLSSYPGERAKIVGRLWVPRGSDYVTIENLDLNGTNAHGTNQDLLPSPTVNSDHATFSDDDVTNDNTLICFNLGNESYGRATNTLIERNRIHNCGVLPAQNHDHGIYVATATNTRIIDNVIYANADRGIQLYPDAQHTTIRGNIIDGNGEGIIFSGDNGTASSDTDVEFNVITNSKLRNNVESYYPAGNPIGQRNVVAHNCISGGVRDTGDGGIGDQTGYAVSDAISAKPDYANRAAGDFTMPSGNPCAALLAGNVPAGQPQSSPSSQPASDAGSAPAPAPTPPTGSATGHGHRAVTLHGHAFGRVLALRGRIHRRRLARAANAGLRQVVIELRRQHRWVALAAVPLSGDHFSSSIELPASLARRTVTLRAVVPSVGGSRAMRVRVGS